MNLTEKLINHRKIEEQIEKEILQDFLNKFEFVRVFIKENKIQSFMFDGKNGFDISSPAKGNLYFQLVNKLNVFINLYPEWKDRDFNLEYYPDNQVRLLVMRDDNYSLFNIYHDYGD